MFCVLSGAHEPLKAAKEHASWRHTNPYQFVVLLVELLAMSRGFKLLQTWIMEALTGKNSLRESITSFMHSLPIDVELLFQAKASLFQAVCSITSPYVACA